MPQIVYMNDVVTASLKSLGVADGTTNQAPSNSEMADGLYVGNEMLDSWNADGTLIYSQQFLTFSLGTFQTNAYGAYYTLGPTGSSANWTMPTGQGRPTNIIAASYQLVTSPAINKPLTVKTMAEWAEIRAASIQTTIPNWICIDENYPIANVYVWPEPVGGSTITFTLWNQLNSNVQLTDQIVLPPGYQRLLRLGIAINLASWYGLPVPPEMAAIYNEVKELIAIQNIRSPRLKYDVPFGPGVYDVLTDETY